MRLDLVLREECQTDTVESSAKHQRYIINNEWSMHCNGQGFLSFLKLPPVEASRAMAKVDALML